MDEVRAATIVSTLASGVNPQTGEVFPPDSPYQSAEVVRALYMAQRALESRSRPPASAELTTPVRSRSLPANAGKPWKSDDDQQLLAEFDRGRSVPELAQSLGRTMAGIQARLEKHGRISPQANVRRPSAWRSGANGEHERAGSNSSE